MSSVTEEGKPETYPTPAHGWTCFHCGKNFPGDMAGQIAARLHFGASIHDEPKCQISAHRLRSIEQQLRSYREEDTELHRALHKLESEHATALRREEEKGYARALRDTNFADDGTHHKLDTDKRVFFYEQDYYVLSNFSAFMLDWNGIVFPTSEHAYHWAKFPDDPLKQSSIHFAQSAHAAFKRAERWKQYRRADWDAVKVGIMREILFAKADQHEYVRRKLLATGDRELIEDSWRDGYWGWGPNRDGQNALGKLWMEVRAHLRGERVQFVGDYY